MPTRETASLRISVRVTPSERKRLLELAAEHGRSISWELRRALRRYLSDTQTPRG